MILTRTALTEKGAEVATRRAMSFDEFAKKKGGSEATKLFPALMVMMSGITINKLADKLGLTEEGNEVDVTKEMFDEASCEVTAESTEGENNSLIYTLDTMVFLRTVSTELYGKGENNETEKADS